MADKLGFGLQPAGTSPAGVGTPLTGTPIGGKPFVDQFNIQRGTRIIDPKTRQYLFNSDGRTVGEENLRHMVKMRCLTVKGSSAWPGGLESYGGTISTGFEERIKIKLRNALLDMTNALLISIQSIRVTRLSNDRIYILLQYTDLKTNELQSLEIK